VYPDAWILALGLFGAEGGGSQFTPFIQTAVTAVGDPKIVFVDTTAWSGGGQFDPVVHLHPLVATHRNIADKLIPKITEITGIEPAATPDLR